jgi:hypothetical protein
MTRPDSGWHRRPRSGAAHAQRQREYATPAYRAAGRTAERTVRTGYACCWRCGGRIPPDARRGLDWQLGHDDHDRRIIRGPEHTKCNLSAAAHKGAAIANRTAGQPRRAQSRQW